MFLAEQNREVVQINNTLDLLGFEDLNIKELRIDEDEKEIHFFIRLKIEEGECPNCGVYNHTLHSVRKIIISHRHFVGKNATFTTTKID